MRTLATATAAAAFAALAALTAPARGSSSERNACSGAPWVVKEAVETASARPIAASDAPVLDVATYNLHSGLGPRHAFFRSRRAVERNLREIAHSIAKAASVPSGPDVVALNEVDFGSRRSGWIDQARFVADELEAKTGSAYGIVRGETWRRDLPGLEVRFGNAVLSRLPMLEAADCLFDDLDSCGIAAPETTPPAPRGLLDRLLAEPRGVIRVTVEAGGRPVDVLTTHLDAFAMREREVQAGILLSRFLRPGRTTVLLGDMNAVPAALTRERWMFSDDRTGAILATGSLADAILTLASHRREASLAAWATYPASAPLWGFDWILGSPDLVPEEAARIGETASDHRGLYVRYRRLAVDADIAAAEARHARVCESLRAFDSVCGRNG